MFAYGEEYISIDKKFVSKGTPGFRSGRHSYWNLLGQQKVGSTARRTAP